MDQGMAAVLGAAVGAIALGGGALLSARSASALHMRQSRREDYLAYLVASSTLVEALLKIEDRFVNRREPADRPIEEADADALLDQLDDALSGMRRAIPRVRLAGPKQAVVCATRAALLADWAQSAAVGWRAAYLTTAVPDEERTEYRGRVELVEAELEDFTSVARPRT
jgi:hypothetical protein